MELQVGVKALLRNREGKYLLVRRSLEKYPEVRNPWDIVGGRINPGAPLLENLRREIREETGLELVGEPRLVGAQDIMNVSRFPDRHVVRLTYVGEVDGEPKLDEEENDAHQWLTLKAMREVDGLDIYTRELLGKGLFGEP